MTDDGKDPNGDGPNAGRTAAQTAATAAAERSFRLFAPLLDGRSSGDNRTVEEVHDARTSDDPFGIGELRRSMRRAVDLYLELAERVFDLSTRSLEQALKPRLASVTPSTAPDALVRLAASPGTRTSAPIWLHNMTDEPLPPARFRCSDLLGSDGSILPASAATIVPETTETVLPGGSCAAVLSIEVPAHAAAVVFVGHAVLVPVPDVALAVRLEVGPPAEDDPAWTSSP